MDDCVYCCSLVVCLLMTVFSACTSASLVRSLARMASVEPSSALASIPGCDGVFFPMAAAARAS
jgi:hypothetical protein